MCQGVFKSVNFGMEHMHPYLEDSAELNILIHYTYSLYIEYTYSLYIEYTNSLYQYIVIT